MYEDDVEDDDDRLFPRREPELLGAFSHGIKVYGHWLSDEELAARTDDSMTWDDGLDEIGICMRTASDRRHELRDALVAAIADFDLVVGVDVPAGVVDGILQAVDDRLAE